MLDADRTVRSFESEGFRFGLLGDELVIQPPTGSSFSDFELRQCQEEIVAYLKERERKNRLQKQGIAQDFSLQEAAEIAPHRAEYVRVMQDAQRRLDGIEDLGPAMGVIERDFPATFTELTMEWMDRLSAATGVVSLKRFQELADAFVARHVELVEMVRTAHEGKVN